MSMFSRIVVLTVVILVSQPFLRARAQGVASHKATVTASPLVEHDPADVLVAACNAAGISLSSPILPAVITKVASGSAAYNADLVERDRVVSGQLLNNVLSLVIERNGHVYAAQINCAPMIKITPNSASHTSESRAQLKPPIAKEIETKTDAKLLSETSSSKKDDANETGDVEESAYIVRVELGVGTSTEGARDWNLLYERECRNQLMRNAWSEWTESVVHRLKTLASIMKPSRCDLRLRISADGHVDDVVVVQQREKGIIQFLTGESVPTNLRRFLQSLKEAYFPDFPSGSAINATYISVSVAPEKSGSQPKVNGKP